MAALSNEKIPETNIFQHERKPPAADRNLDDAHSFLRDNATLDTSHVDLKLLRRKVDRHLIPLLFFVNFMQSLDSHLLNYAIIMGLPEDLNLKGQQLNNIASSIHWVHIAAATLVGFYLNRFAIGKSLGWSMLIWAILITCTCAVKKYEQMLAIRLLMGLFDCVFKPVMTLLTSQFYRKDEQLERFQLWWCSYGIASVLGAFVSYGFQFVHATQFHSWQIMYLVLGSATIMISIWALVCLPDSPMEASFLTREEKVALLRHVSTNATGVNNHRIKAYQVLAVFSDPQIWLALATFLLNGFGIGIMGTYGTTLIRSFGYSRKESTLLNAPSGAIGFVACLLSAWLVRKHYLQRWSTIALTYGIAAIGACLAAFAPRKEQAAHLAGIFIFGLSSSTVGIKYQWLAANVAGQTKRPIVMALLTAAFTAGTIAGPYAVQKKDAPDYYTAKHSVVASKAGCLVLISMLALYYLCVNRRRNRSFGKPVDEFDSSDESRAFDEDSMSDMWANLTDRERRRTFRYMY